MKIHRYSYGLELTQDKLTFSKIWKYIEHACLLYWIWEYIQHHHIEMFLNKCLIVACCFDLFLWVEEWQFFCQPLFFFEKPSHFIYLPLHLKIHHGLQSISIINLLFSTLENFSDGNFLVNLLWKGIGAIL